MKMLLFFILLLNVVCISYPCKFFPQCIACMCTKRQNNDSPETPTTPAPTPIPSTSNNSAIAGHSTVVRTESTPQSVQRQESNSDV